MPADASIFNALMQPRKTAFDYANEFEQQGTQRQMNALQLQSAQLQNQNALQAQQDDQALRRYVGSGADLNTPEGQAGLYKVAPKAAPAILKQRMDAQKAAGESVKLSGENLDAGLARYRKMLDGVDNPQAAVQWLQAQYSDPVVGPVMQKMAPFEEAVKRIPMSPQEFAVWRQKSGMGMEAYQKHIAPKPETLDLGGKKVVIDLNPNSPTFKQQIIEQQVSSPASDMLLPDGQGGFVPNTPLIEAKKSVAKAGASSVSVNTGQKGYENESKLRNDFKSEPIYKDFNDMKSAHAQITAALKQESPIADTAAATKIMKLLDPGSVVRESELGMAMAAAGKLDRLQNMVQMWANGQKLTPTQRKDFKVLADELYDAAGQAYNSKRSEYAKFGKGYGLNEDVLGGPAVSPKPTADGYTDLGGGFKLKAK